MSLLKKLAGQTALYGLPSILVRFLNYLLVPIHVSQFNPDVYGIITELYAYVAFFVVLLTYGMETTYFKFSLNHDKDKVYNNALGSIFITTVLFVIVGFSLSAPLASILDYGEHPEYLNWLVVVLAFDAITAIPMARLRQEEKAFKFATVSMIGIGVNIAINVLFIGYCMPLAKAGKTNFIVDFCYNPAIGVGYVFIANVAGSVVKGLLLYGQIIKLRFNFEWNLLKQMIAYAAPLLIVGIAGTVNETFSRGFFKYFLEDRLGHQNTMFQLGVFGGVYKLSILITLFIQAYRYAAEPFFFQQSQQSGGGKVIYVQMMNMFTFIVFSMFLTVTLFIDLFKQFINNPAYWEGLKIVPVLLLANAFLGISYNLSVWYKLSGKTIYGAYIAVIGAVVTLVLNYLLIPTLGYVGAAWSTFACYATIMILSFILGQKHYPIPYQLGKNIGFLALALALFFADKFLITGSGIIQYGAKACMLLFYASIFLVIEKPKFLFKNA